MNDQERVTDLLFTEKKLCGNYNTYASECTNAKLRSTLLQLVESGHGIQTRLFDMASARGWYQTTPADTAQVNRAYQKYQAMA